MPAKAPATLKHLAAQAGEDLALVHRVAVVVERGAAVEPVLAALAAVVQLLAAQQVVHEVVPQAEALAAALADVRLLSEVLAAHVAVHPLLRGEHLLAAVVGAGDGVPRDVRLVAVQAMAAETGGCGEVQAADVAHVLLSLSPAVPARLGCFCGRVLGAFRGLLCGVFAIAVVVCGSFVVAAMAQGASVVVVFS